MIFLPATRKEMTARAWDEVDVVLVTGDAYIDHPSFGVALIGRWLEAHGYRVAVLSQPRHDNPEDFHRFGRPRLFFGISAGNLDSIVSNYTGNAKVRDRDVYSPDGDPYFGGKREKTQRRRPDRAVTRYAQLARAAYPGVPIVLGGLEASLRRFVHYDYQQQRLRGSVLADAKADLLVYGMGELAVLEIARRLEAGRDLHGIAGTCERLSDRERASAPGGESSMELPSWDHMAVEPRLFLEAELSVDREARALSNKVLLQRQQAAWVLQHPAAPPLTTAQLDALYELPFTRVAHPTSGNVPAYTMIRHSVTVVRGCCGNCSFCAIARHQGPVVTSRSVESVLREVQRVVAMPDFRGTISDLGGPTANLYGTSCKRSGACVRHDCLYPKICPHLHVDEEAMLRLLDRAAAVPGVRHVFVSSGLRMELLLKTPRLLSRLIEKHTPGAMKIAPEHTEKSVLRLMHKPGAQLLPDFLSAARTMGNRLGKNIRFTPYLICSHPGCTVKDMRNVRQTMKALGLEVRQFQDFTPTPGTISTAMFVSGLDRETMAPIPIPRTATERRAQRKILEDM